MPSIGRSLMIASNLSYCLGAFLADFNETHVKNPRWPPHAKFHNAQTMNFGILLCALALYLLARPRNSPRADKESLSLAAVVGSFYAVAALCSIFYPETKWADPEFGTGNGGFWIFLGVLTINWTGYALEIMSF